MLALIDLDGTVVDRDAAFARWLGLFAETHGLTPQQHAWVVEWDQRSKERRRFFDGLVDHLRLDESAAQLWEAYRTVMPRLTVAFPGVEPALRNLKAVGWQVVVLTNGQVDNQLGKLRATGLLGLFDGCRVSGETGLRKPDPSAFVEAVIATGYLGQREKAWMVGDDPMLDIAGAHRVGLRTVWIAHGRQWPSEQQPPTVAVESPAEAFQRLAKLTS